MELREYVGVLRARRGIVIAALVLFTVAALAATALRPATYTAEARMMVSSGSQAGALLGMQGLQSFQPDRDMNTHAELVRSPAVAEEVIERRGLSVSVPELLRGVEAEPVGSSDLLAVRATAPGPGRAASLANTFATVYAEQRAAEQARALEVVRERLEARREAASERLAGLREDAPEREAAAGTLASIEQQLETLRTGGALGLDRARVVVPASADRAAGGPGLLSGAMVGLAVGLVVGVGAAFTAEHFDTRIRTLGELSAAGVRVVGAVAAERSMKGSGVVMMREPGSAAADSYRMVRRLVRRDVSAGPSTPVLLVTAPRGGEGVAGVSGNLAVALAQSGDRVTLIDGDFRQSSVKALFGLAVGDGLGDVLSGSRQFAEVAQRPLPTLAVVGAGSHVNSPADALGSSRMRAVLREAASGSDWVVLSAPPLLEHSDALSLIDDASMVILVARAKDTRAEEVEQSGRLLERFGSRAQVRAVLLGGGVDIRVPESFTAEAPAGEVARIAPAASAADEVGGVVAR